MTLIALTKWISGSMIHYWKALPIVLMVLCWLFFTGFRMILKTKEKRIQREFLLSVFCFGIGFAFLCFGTYGLVDPVNGLARAKAAPVSAGDLARFAWMGYLSIAAALIAGLVLEISLRRTSKAA